MHPSRRGNALVVTIILVAIVLAAGIALMLVWTDGMVETIENTTSSTSVQRDSILEPVAMWAAQPITKYASEHDGALPDNDQGKALIAAWAKSDGRPEIEGANDFTVTPIYRRTGKGNFDIILPTSEIGGKAHLTFPFTAKGESLAAVPNNVFLSEKERARNPLEEEPSPGIGK
jgi:hypothetical protein